ncbi:MAG: hypothetical protein LUQ24_04150 [Methanobacterium sp.]|nr:hypothetical protein [Methanobacterium sp.]
MTSNTAGQFSPAIYNNYDLFNIGTGKTSAAATSKGEDCSSHNSRFLIYMNLLSNYTYFDYVNEIEITIPVFAVLDTGGYSLNSTYTFRFRTTGD